VVVGKDFNRCLVSGGVVSVQDELSLERFITCGAVVHILGSLELPESDIDGDTTLTLSLQLVKHPGILEGTLAELGGFLHRLLAIVPRGLVYANERDASDTKVKERAMVKCVAWCIIAGPKSCRAHSSHPTKKLPLVADKAAKQCRL